MCDTYDMMRSSLILAAFLSHTDHLRFHLLDGVEFIYFIFVYFYICILAKKGSMNKTFERERKKGSIDK